RDGVEVFGQIGVHHLGVASTEKFMHFPNRVLGAALRSVAVSTGFHVRLEDRLQHQLGSGLRHSVPYGRYPQRSFAAPRLRNRHPPHRLRSIPLGAELLPDLGQHFPNPPASISAKVCPSTPAAPRLNFT